MLLSTKRHSFCNLIFFCPNNYHVFHKHTQIFKYQPGCLKFKELTVNRINKNGLSDFTVPDRPSKLFCSIWPCQTATGLLVKAEALCWFTESWCCTVRELPIFFGSKKWINTRLSVAVLWIEEGRRQWRKPEIQERGYPKGMREREEPSKLYNFRGKHRILTCAA